MKKSSYCADIASETLPNVFSRETRKREPLFYGDSYDSIGEIRENITRLGIHIANESN
jgi:hypothetical protein